MEVYSALLRVLLVLLACSTGCPNGQYQSKPCSNFGDRVCSACTRCTDSTYEARPCQDVANRQCMHVAHPLLITGGEKTPVYLEGLKVEASENVFLENLHSTRNLETTYYVTDITQASDFFWMRESGLQVHIGILDVALIPKYVDVSHDSDNKYMLDNPNTSEDKSKFRNIARNYCRHPIPDYYSITLEISRDRITTADQVVCDSDGPKKTKCPSQYNNGDEYLDRSLNDACQKMAKGTFPDPLLPAANSIVCTKQTNLLRDIFNQSFSVERAIRFPPRRCRTANSRCKQCLNQLRCQMIDIFEQQCCQIDCYILKDCKQSTSEYCSQTPVECAMGDAYRYTIQPVFQNLKKEFQCHVQHAKPTVLYKMFFHIKVPGPYGPESELETGRVYKTVYSHDFDYQSSGSLQADYISVEHSTGLHLKDEYILLGREKSESKSAFNYTVYPVQMDAETREKKVVVHEISHNIFVASTQFDKPFAYSTSSWVRGNECDKNVDKFRYVQKHYSGEAQNVNVMIQNTNSPYEYFLKSMDNPPYIRFLVPGNTSVLPWYFKDNGPILYTNESLQIKLDLIAGGRIWDIHFSGLLSECPGYVGFTINDLMEEEELFNYDTLIFCPTHFNMTFKVPNRGQRPDRTFEINLRDARRNHSVYLTHMLFEANLLESPREKLGQEIAPPSPWAFVVVVVVATALLLILCNLMYVYLEYTKVKAILKKEDNYYPRTEEVNPNKGMCGSGNHLTHRQYVFIVAYVVFRIVYSLFFTFTVFLALVSIVMQSDISRLSRLTQFQQEKNNESRHLAIEIDNYSQDELLRQAELVTTMQGACSHYIEELFESMLFQVDNITLNQHHSLMYSPQTSMSSLMQKLFDYKMSMYIEQVTGYTDTYQANFTKAVKPSLQGYTKYLNKVHGNEWFRFPQLLFNMTNFSKERPHVFKRSNVSGSAVDFGAFLPVEEVEDVQLWAIQYWERFEEEAPKAKGHERHTKGHKNYGFRYRIKQPSIPKLRVPEVRAGSPRCDLPADMPYTNMSRSSRPEKHLDSSHYFATSLPGTPARGPTFKSEHVFEEYKYLTADSNPTHGEAIFSIEDFTKSLTLELLRVVFVVLDVLLLLYRCSRTFVTARTLCQGFDETKDITTCGEQLSREVKSLQAQLRQDNHGVHTTAATMDHHHVGAVGSSTANTTANTNTDYNHPHHHASEYLTNTQVDLDHSSQHQSMLPPPPPHLLNHNQNGSKQHHTLNKHPMHNHPLPPAHTPNASSNAPTDPLQNGYKKWVSKKSRWHQYKDFALQVAQCTIIPKLAVGTVVFLLGVLLVQCVQVLLSVEVMAEVDGFRAFLSSLEVQVNQTNWYLAQQAQHLNDITMEIYKSQMRSELSHLQSMLEYFNVEQDRLVDNFISEACAVKKELIGNKTCDIHVTPAKLEIPMVPCNFIPVTPRLYKELDEHFSLLQMGADFELYLSAARGLFVKSAYAILCTVSVMLSCHAAGIILFHFLRTRRLFPVHRTLVTSIPLVTVTQAKAPQEGSENESEDDEENELKTYATNVPTSPEKLKSLLASFKYSETKV